MSSNPAPGDTVSLCQWVDVVPVVVTGVAVGPQGGKCWRLRVGGRRVRFEKHAWVEVIL